MKLLSIIVPVYNSEKYLGRCLDSIASQSYKEWECLLIDDGSTDSSSEICKAYSEDDSRFKYIRKANGGVADSRNYGLQRALGEYIAFADNDDLLHPMMYQTLIDSLENTNSEISCCKYIKDFRSYDDVEKEIAVPIGGGQTDVLSDRESIYYSIVKGNQANGIEGLIWNKVYRKSVLNEIWFNTNIALVDDADFSLRLFKDVHKVCYVNLPFYHWMQHVNNQTATGSYSKYASAADTYEDMVHYLDGFIKKKETGDIIRSQSLIWNLNALERGLKEHRLDKSDRRHYKSVIRKYKKYGNYYNKKVQAKMIMIAHVFPLFELYAHLK